MQLFWLFQTRMTPRMKPHLSGDNVSTETAIGVNVGAWFDTLPPLGMAR